MVEKEVRFLTFLDGSATEYAITTVRKLPPGTYFTTKKIFEGTLIIDCDQRCKGAIMRELERGYIIENMGATIADQQDRHNGLGTLWRKL